MAVKKKIMTEREYYRSNYHMKSEKSYADYKKAALARKSKPKKRRSSNALNPFGIRF